MIKPKIKVIFELELDTDTIEQALNDGYTESEIRKDIQTMKLSSRFVRDNQIIEVESILETSKNKSKLIAVWY